MQDCVGIDYVDVNVVWCFFECQVMGKMKFGGFGCVVGVCVGRGCKVVFGVDKDD